MNRNGYAGPKLPKTLLDRVGGAEKKGKGDVSRQDRRKAERQAKKSAYRPGPVKRLGRTVQRHNVVDDEDDGEVGQSVSSAPQVVRKQPAKDAKPLKSILRPAKTVELEATPETELEQEDEEEEDEELSAAESEGSFTVSRQAAKAGLADEDDEIAALERKLGLKGKKGTKHFDDDELEWMVTGSDSEDERPSLKRKRPDDAEWLRDKRLKAGGAELSHEDGDDDDSDVANRIEEDSNDDEELDGLWRHFSEDELYKDAFAGFESEDDPEPPPPTKRERENPYVAPVSKAAASAEKYFPPSLRKPASSDEEALKQLRRQMRGQLNRLSDANLLSILQATDQMYEKHARQHVTSTLVDLLVSLVSDPSTLNDTFIILHAGFAAAEYKVIGTDFGAQLLEKLVETFDRYRDDSSAEGKQQLNLIAFLCNLYTFQVVGSVIMLDYIRLLLDDLSEHNTELLLRMIRTLGVQLRQEDPTALKDIALLLQRHVANTGDSNLSVRTKFMIDTIKDLKNNRMKTGVAASAIAAEHTTRMKKILRSLNTHSLRAAEPLRVTLADIEDSEKKGKWWLIGASYHDPAKLANANSAASKSATARRDDADAGYESDTPGHTNLTKAARAQGMNTDVRRMIFVNMVGADDFKDAYQRLQALRLKAKQQQEIPRVLLHCVGVEDVFNPFYALLARRLCEDGKTVQKAFRFPLWDVLKRMSAVRDDGSDDEETGAELGLQRIVKLAKFYGFLVADGTVPISALKTADFALLQPHLKAYTFAEVLFSTLFSEIRKKAKDAPFEAKIKSVFATASGAPQMIQGLQYFLRTVVASASLVNSKKEARAVKEGCKIAVEALRQVAEEATVVDDGDESDMD